MKNIDEALKRLAFRIGSETVTIAKRIAPIGKGSGHYRGGNLRKDIKVISYKKDSVTIGNTQKAPYAKFVHDGTRPHIIKAKNKKVLANKRAGVVFGKKVKHPGNKANPYLMNAWEAYKRDGGLARALNSLGSEVSVMVKNKIKKSLSPHSW